VTRAAVAAESARRLGVGSAFVDGELVAGDVEVRHGLVSAVGLTPSGSGIAVAGLVDIQVNGYGGVDVGSTDAEGIHRAGRALASDGVLAWCPTIITGSDDAMVEGMVVVAAAAASRPADAARILGAHVEGPFLSPVRAGVHPRDHLRAPDRGLVDRLFAAGPLAILSLAPELPGALTLIADMAARGVVMSAAHTDATAEQARDAFEAGIRATTHTWNGMRPLGHREPGIIGAALVRPGISIGLVGDGVHVAPEVMALTWRAAGDRICLTTFGVAAAGAPDGTYSIGEVVIERLDGRVVDRDGRVGGGTTPLLEAVRIAVGLGVPVPVALAAVTTNPATMLGRTDVGRLHPGVGADLVILGDDLALRAVLMGGREIAHA
jgi:N-acetylglucosamine-6-phosphate deacetylase